MITALKTMSGNFNYTSTGTNTNVMTIDTRGCGPQGKMTIVITNGAGQSVYYTILGYYSDATATVGKYATIKAQTSIAASTAVTSTDVVQNYAAVVLQIQQNSGSSVVNVDYCTF